LAIVGLIALLLVHAERANALIVQSFQVPPALATQGLSGQVVATQILDKLADMQAHSESMRAASSYDNNWGDDLKIDIPNTGATADQVWKLLRGWLGKETRISGEVIDTPDGLALTARAGTKPGERFVSKTSNLDDLVTKAAELIYRETQPYRYSVYLDRFPERRAEKHALLVSLTADPSDRERKWAFNGLTVDARRAGQPRLALAWVRRALAIDPQMPPGFANLVDISQGLGHDQDMVDLLARQHALPPGNEYDPQVIAGNLCSEDAYAADAQRDPVRLEQAAACLDSATASFAWQAPANHMLASLLRHDSQPALSFRQAATRVIAPEQAAAMTSGIALGAQLERGSSSDLAKALTDFSAASAAEGKSGPFAAYFQHAAPMLDWPKEAQVLLQLGRVDEAAALIARTPLDCYSCVRMRGLVEEARGNAPAAQRWFAEAARQGPRLAPAFADWGGLLADAHHYDTAEVKLAYAARLAPNWADPLKYWGDMLAAEGKRDEALAKYEAALRLAPNWAELRRARAVLGGQSHG
jgi:tetratricopeptide (TPR) repeat protein